MCSDGRCVMREVDELAVFATNVIDGEEVREARELPEQRKRCKRDRCKP